MNVIFDFLLLGAIAAACFVIFKVLAARMPNDSAYKSGVGIALVTALLLFWVNGAVGIIGSEDNDANMMYFGVIATAFGGSALTRFQPLGMARTMWAAAAAQVLVAVIALSAGWGIEGPIWPRHILFLNGFFAALWAASALLFRHAASVQPPAEPKP